MSEYPGLGCVGGWDLGEEGKRSSGFWPFAFAFDIKERTVVSFRVMFFASKNCIYGSSSFAIIFLLESGILFTAWP